MQPYHLSKGDLIIKLKFVATCLLSNKFNMDPRLYKAAKSGNTSILKEILNRNPSLISKLTPQENTLLHIAVQFGHLKAVSEIYGRCQSLLSRHNLEGDTPFHVAARYGHFQVVDFLIRESLSTSWKDIEIQKSSKFDILKRGNKKNDTVLHEAVRNGHVCVVKLLLNVAPELACFENYSSESPLFLAAGQGMTDIVNQVLMCNPSLLHSGPDGQTALHAAVMERHSEVVQVLLRAKSNLITEADNHNRTPIHYAASLGDHKTVKRLLEVDISVAYISDKNGHSAIHIAAEKGHLNVIKQIICCCPDAGELLDLNGRSALHFAVLSEKPNVVRFVLQTAELEGLVNKADNDGNTPLHLAAIEKKTWILRCLMWDGRVNQRAKNKNGQTVFDIDNSIREWCITCPRNLVKNFWRKLGSELVDTTQIDNYRQTGQTLLMVATLITTVTFTAAFTMPGGFNDIGPDRGEALLQKSNDLKFFIISDSIAMTSSIFAACIIFWGSISRNESYIYYFTSATILTYLAVITTGIAFSSGVAAVFPDHHYATTLVTLIGYVFQASTCFLLFQLVRIFPFSETWQFLNSHVRKMKFNHIKKQRPL